MGEVTVRRDSAGYTSEVSYPYIAKTNLFDDNSRKELIYIRIGKEEDLQLLDGMYFYILDINNNTMKFIPDYISDHLRVTYEKE